MDEKTPLCVSENNGFGIITPICAALGIVSQTRQFGRSLASVLSGAAQNIKSKIAGMGAASPSAWGHPWAGDGKIHLDRASNYFMDALNARDSQQT